MAGPGEDAEVGPGDGLATLLGIEFGAAGPERASARLPVTERILQPYGVVHGGAHGVLAESLCSWATDRAVREQGLAAFGQSSQASFLRPISAGSVHAEATVRHRGRSTWVWDCELRDDHGRLCALVRMTVAVRPRAG
jgi:1,4-dihydroxy-2-naphthoyl-CoA hydrolase